MAASPLVITPPSGYTINSTATYTFNFGEEGSTIYLQTDSFALDIVIVKVELVNGKRLSNDLGIITVTVSGGIASGYNYIRLNSMAGAITLTLGAPTEGRVLKFKRLENNPATPITFIGTIDGTVNPTTTGGGSPIATLATQYASLTLIGNGASWDVAD
jgi:hypothetical protein